MLPFNGKKRSVLVPPTGFAEEEEDCEHDAGGVHMKKPDSFSDFIELSDFIEKGSSQAELGNMSNALNIFYQGLLQYPDDATLFELKAQVLMECDRWLEAAVAAEQACSLSPAYPEAHITLARARRGIGEVSFALNSYERAKALLTPIGSSDKKKAGLLTEVQLEIGELLQWHQQQSQVQHGYGQLYPQPSQLSVSAITATAPLASFTATSQHRVHALHNPQHPDLPPNLTPEQREEIVRCFYNLTSRASVK